MCVGKHCVCIEMIFQHVILFISLASEINSLFGSLYTNISVEKH